MPTDFQSRILDIAPDGEVLGEVEVRLYRRRWKWFLVVVALGFLGLLARHYFWSGIDPIDDSDLKATWVDHRAPGNAWDVWKEWEEGIRITSEESDWMDFEVSPHRDPDLNLLRRVVERNRLSEVQMNAIRSASYFCV